jgi:hypothetical protein
MGWLILLVVIVGASGLYVRSSSKKREPPRLALRQPSRPAQSSPRPGLAAEELRIRREVEAEAARMMREVEAEAARMAPEIDAEAARMAPEIEAEAARIHAESMHEAAAVAFNQDDSDPVEEVRRVIWREDYVAKKNEGRYLSRRADGLPNLYLADAGDRLAIWSPIADGGLINPKGPGVRHFGLYASYARGADHYRSAYRAADLSKGKWIDLVREPDNPHDKNAVAMCVPGSRVPFAYVQRGRALAVARRMDAGEDMAAVSLRGPGRGRDDESTLVLVGSRSDLTAMLGA